MIIDLSHFVVVGAVDVVAAALLGPDQHLILLVQHLLDVLLLPFHVLLNHQLGQVVVLDNFRVMVQLQLPAQQLVFAFELRCAQIVRRCVFLGGHDHVEFLFEALPRFLVILLRLLLKDLL